MIAHLSGKVLLKFSDQLVVDVGGVGYQVFTTTTILNNLSLNSQISFYIYTHLTESYLHLFGFEKASELQFFRSLISISGIGPKLALSILSFSQTLLSRAIMNKDIEALTEIPGVGKKTAERLILELKNKLVFDEAMPVNKSMQEAMEALQNLGFSRNDASSLLTNAPQEINTSEELIRFALQRKEN